MAVLRWVILAVLIIVCIVNVISVVKKVKERKTYKSQYKEKCASDIEKENSKSEIK